jgi:endonuclease/exonuclease/phosphatase family metal-dependent hydrolase
LLKVLTLNLWNHSGPWERRLPRVRGWVDKLEPDVIGFQEVYYRDDYNQAAEILDGLGYAIECASVIEYESFRFGNAVCSRWPVIDTASIELPTGERSEGRCAINARIDAPFGELSFTSTHLNWKLHDGRSRETQVVALADFVLSRRPRGGFPPIVVGDFNAEPHSDEIRFMTGFHSLDGRSVMFFDAWRLAGDGGPGTSWSNRNDFASIALEPERRIDYIFAGYPRRMTEDHGVGKVEACRVVCDDEVDGIWPSDHFGVYAELRTDPLGKPRWTMS